MIFHQSGRRLDGIGAISRVHQLLHAARGRYYGVGRKTREARELTPQIVCLVTRPDPRGDDEMPRGDVSFY